MSKTNKSKLSSPYSFSTRDINKHRICTFDTDTGIQYGCYFSYLTPNLSPLLGIYDIQVYDFSFFPNTKDYPGKDERVAPTILGILNEFMQAVENVAVYMCDNEDGRSKERQRLFKMWHSNVKDTMHRDDLTIAFELDDGTTENAYGCILTRNDFPHRDVLQTELIDQAKGIVLAKYGA